MLTGLPLPKPEPHSCHVDDCGRSCPTCGERVLCVGPEPVAIACPAHDDECAPCNGDNPCKQCAMFRRSKAIWDSAADARPEPMTGAEEWGSYWGEQRAEEQAYELALLKAREEDARW